MFKIIDRDLGWSTIMKNLTRIDGAYVKVGWIDEGTVKIGTHPTKRQSYKSTPSMSDLATIAVVQEFGSDSKRIPERPMLRETFDKEKSSGRLNKQMAKVLKNAVSKNMFSIKKLEKFGEYYENKVKGTIEKKKTPKNAKETIRKKGFDDPLINTGTMKESVSNHVVTNSLRGEERVVIRK